MGTKRRKDRILARILETCRGEGEVKTTLVSMSGLDFETIMPYLLILEGNGLIEIVSGKYPLYRITPKGEEAKIHLQALEELMPIYVPDDVIETESDENAILRAEISQDGRILDYASRLETEIYDKIFPIYSEMQEENIRDIKSKTLEFLKFKLLDLTASNKHVKWLEIGCGDGKSLEVLDMVPNRNNIYYHGIDSSDKYLNEAQKRAEKYGIDHNIEKRSPAKNLPEREYDIEIAISIFHQMDPFSLPLVLRNMVQALKEDGTIIISDFQELYDQENNFVNWSAEDIKYILQGIYGDIYFSPENIPVDVCPSELSFYRGIIKKPNMDNYRFDEFMKTYDSFMEMKKERSREKIVALKNQIGIRVEQILKAENIEAEKMSAEDLSRIRDGIEGEYGIKALKIKLLTRELVYIEDKIKLRAATPP